MIETDVEVKRMADSQVVELVEACLDVWSVQTASNLSTRAISRVAGVPATSIYNNFDDLEHLFRVAHQHALKLAARWCAARLAEFEDVEIPAERFGDILAGVMDDWCTQQRRLAIAWLECRLKAARQSSFVPLALEWQALWGSFWTELCGRFGLADRGLITLRFFEGESSYHLVPWRRSIDRAALGDFCAGWARWMVGHLSPAAPWRDVAQAEAARTMPDLHERDPASRALAQVAADVVVQHGVRALTYRQVAAAAGKTLGFVSHKFATSSELLQAAFEAMTGRMRPLKTELLELRGKSADEFVDWLLNLTFRESSSMFEMTELLLECSRDEALKPFAVQLRYLRGGTATQFLSAILGKAVAPTDGAIMQSFGGGLRSGHSLGKSQQESIRDARAELSQLIAILSGAG